jgi:hypothetical protein
MLKTVFVSLVTESEAYIVASQLVVGSWMASEQVGAHLC